MAQMETILRGHKVARRSSTSPCTRVSSRRRDPLWSVWPWVWVQDCIRPLKPRHWLRTMCLLRSTRAACYTATWTTRCDTLWWPMWSWMLARGTTLAPSAPMNTMTSCSHHPLLRPRGTLFTGLVRSHISCILSFQESPSHTRHPSLKLFFSSPPSAHFVWIPAADPLFPTICLPPHSLCITLLLLIIIIFSHPYLHN